MVWVYDIFINREEDEQTELNENVDIIDSNPFCFDFVECNSRASVIYEWSAVWEDKRVCEW